VKADQVVYPLKLDVSIDAGTIVAIHAK